MKKTEWERNIVENCKAAGTYQTYFDDVISTLAMILELRDDAVARFKKSGAETVIEKHLERKDNTNTVKHPALVLIMELNGQALSYWRELGLTPSGLKKINEDAMKGKKRSVLADALKELGG